MTIAKVAAAAALAFTLAGAAAHAADKPKTEKCYGVALAGKNDCNGGRGHELRRHLGQGLSGQCLEGREGGHLHQDQDPQGHGIADAPRLKPPPAPARTPPPASGPFPAR
jgi:hypothetical protein